MKKIVLLIIAATLFASCGTPATEVEVVNEVCDTTKACVDTCKAVEAATVVATTTVATATLTK